MGTSISIVYAMAYWGLGPFALEVDYAFFGVWMVLLGIPHGAADHLISKKTSELRNETFSIAKFSFSYVGVMVLYAAFWYFAPTAAFVVFILISVFHFGDMEETEGASNKSYFIELITKICLGSGILAWILLLHTAEMKQILSDYAWAAKIEPYPIAPYVSAGLIAIGFRKSNRIRFINTAITLIIGSFIPLLPAFICYFACCHALYSLDAMSRFLRISISALYIKLIPFSLAAFVLGILYLRLPTNEHTVYVIFVFLSLLTLPHFFLMHKQLKKRV